MPDLTPAQRQLCQQVRTACAANQLRKAARGLTQRYDAALIPSGVRVTQLPILVALGIKGESPITPLAELLALDRTTLTRNLKVLAENGLVTFTADGSDARVRMVALSESGSQALGQALELWRGVQEGIEEQFGQPRLHSLFGELSALSATAQD